MNDGEADRTTLWTRALRVEAAAALATPVARALLAASVVMAVVSGSANISVLDDLAGEGPMRTALHGATVPALVFALVAGSCGASTDRRHAVTDQRLLTDPSRLRWLAAKAFVQAAIGLLYGLLGVITASVTAVTAFALRGATFDLTSIVVARSFAGVILGCALFAALGTAAGSLTTNTAAAVTVPLVWVLVVEPPAVVGLPSVGRLFPAAAGLALTYSPDPELLGQLTGAALLGAYTAFALGAALRRIGSADL